MTILAGSSELVFLGELDVSSSRAVTEAVQRLLPATGVHATLDLRALWFCDAAGLRGLAGSYAHLAGAGTGETVRVLPPAAFGPRRLLHLTAARGWIAGAFATARLAR